VDIRLEERVWIYCSPKFTSSSSLFSTCGLLIKYEILIEVVSLFLLPQFSFPRKALLLLLIHEEENSKETHRSFFMTGQAPGI